MLLKADKFEQTDCRCDCDLGVRNHVLVVWPTARAGLGLPMIQGGGAVCKLQDVQKIVNKHANMIARAPLYAYRPGAAAHSLSTQCCSLFGSSSLRLTR